MVVTGASVDGSVRALELSRGSPQTLRATSGCHPHHASELTQEALQTLEICAQDCGVAAVGECGLDYFRDFSPRDSQRRGFIAQLDIAARLGKPVFLHQRDAHADFYSILREHWPRLHGGVAHCFTSGAAELEAYLELGLHIGITGWICDERRGTHLPALMPMIPAGRLMIETDGPYLLPRDLRPKPASRRNEPMYLAHIAKVVAAARGESPRELAAHTTAAARKFFGFAQLNN
jgi:TatD DNase family protein